MGVNLSYNQNIPQGPDATLKSQAQLRANFQIINEVFADNHMPLNDNLQGMHRVITFQPQGSDPATGADQVALYNKLDGSSLPELFFRPHNSATPIQMTYPSINTSSMTTQQTFVPGPFVVYTGRVIVTTNGQMVTVSPASTLLFVGVDATNSKGPFNDVPIIIPTDIVGATFKLKFYTLLTLPIDAYYMAIGQ